MTNNPLPPPAQPPKNTPDAPPSGAPTKPAPAGGTTPSPSPTSTPPAAASSGKPPGSASTPVTPKPTGSGNTAPGGMAAAPVDITPGQPAAKSTAKPGETAVPKPPAKDPQPAAAAKPTAINQAAKPPTAPQVVPLKPAISGQVPTGASSAVPSAMPNLPKPTGSGNATAGAGKTAPLPAAPKPLATPPAGAAPSPLPTPTTPPAPKAPVNLPKPAAAPSATAALTPPVPTAAPLPPNVPRPVTPGALPSTMAKPADLPKPANPPKPPAVSQVPAGAAVAAAPAPLPTPPGQTPSGLPKPSVPGGGTLPTPAAGKLPGTPGPAGVPATPGGPIPSTAAPASAAGTTPGGGATPPPADGKQPMMANLKKSPLRFLPFVLGGLVLVGVVIFAISAIFGGNKKKATPTPSTPSQQTNRTTVPGKQTALTYWTLWEPCEVFEPAFSDFERANPGTTVECVKQSPKDYRERLQTAVASGNGPDVFRFHASWTPMLKAELAAMPSSVMSASEFQKTFYPVAAKQLQVNGQIVGVPLMYDGLALYYNKEILKAAGATPPTTWSELRTLAQQLTVRSATGIERGGVAIGNSTNVEHFADVLGLLMIQNGADPANPTGTEARDALTFYTNFVKVDKVWDDKLPNSTIAFARGDVAMMFAPSWRVHEIKAQNPNLDFGITSVPKLAENRIGWATYWAEGVSAQGKNKDLSWKLLQHMSSAEVMKKTYAAQAQVRTFGEPYSRVDLATSLAADPYLAAYLSDAPVAQGWYLNSATYDNGINDQLIKYYNDAVIAVNGGKAPAEALVTVDQGTKQVLRQYGVSTGATGAGGR